MKIGQVHLHLIYDLVKDGFNEFLEVPRLFCTFTMLFTYF